MPKAKKNKKSQFHEVTEQDLLENPTLAQHGVEAGDEVELPMDDLLVAPKGKEVVVNGKVYIDTTDEAGCTYRNLKE